MFLGDIFLRVLVRIFPGSVPKKNSSGNISEDVGSGIFLDQYQILFLGEFFLRILVVGFFLDRCQGIFLRILVVGFFLGQHQNMFEDSGSFCGAKKYF